MPNVESILIQGGIAGVFAIFVIIMTRETLKYMSARDKIIIDITKQVTELSVNIAHLTDIVATLKDCIAKEGKNARQTSEKLETVPRTTPRRKVKGVSGSDN